MNVMDSFDPAALKKGDFDSAYDQALSFHHQARKEGLLALDAAAHDPALPPVFREGVILVIDGADPSRVLAGLSEMILKEDSPRKLALGVLYMQAVFSLQKGESDAVLKIRMTTPLGIEAVASVIEELPDR